MKTGVQRTYNYLKGLDSGFRRNDRKAYLQTFYEIINFNPSFGKMEMVFPKGIG